MKPITFYAALTDEKQRDLSQRLSMIQTLGDVVPWSLANKTSIHEVVVQDEYTHDVVVPLAEDLVIVFDTT